MSCNDLEALAIVAAGFGVAWLVAYCLAEGEDP